SRFGDVNVIEPSASAVGQMVFVMLEHFGFPITPTIATNLYVALLTDTGGFRHENTTPQALEDAARLAKLGADPGHIATMVYKMRPETTLKLSGLSLATMRVELQGRLTGAHRVGHAGTLDPLATGVLPILFESATRLAEFALRLPKTYLADIHLGFRTATDDAEATPEPVADPSALDAAAVEAALDRFRGLIEQRP